MSFFDDTISENNDLENILTDIDFFLKKDNYNITVEIILEFLQNHPQYKNCEYYSFANPIEKALYHRYIGNIDEINVLPINERLDLLYYYLGFSYFYLNEIDDAEKYLKIANKINPVSAPILNQLCLIYQEKHDFVKVKKIVDELFNYTYDKNILTSTYFKLADYHYHFTQNIEMYKHLFNFYTYLISNQEINHLGDDLAYFKQNNIQIGFNIRLFEISANFYKESTEKSLTNLSNYFKDFFNELAAFNNHLENLEDKISFEGINNYILNLIKNNEYEKAIEKAEEFLDKNYLDVNINYKFFYNDMERMFYENSSNFDENFTLLEYNMNYCYLYYLIAYCFDRVTKFEKAEEYYLKSLKFAPYSVSLNLNLIQTKISRNQSVKIPQLISLSKICYTKKDLLKVYTAFSRTLEINRCWEEVSLVDLLIEQLNNCAYSNLNPKALNIFKKYNFDLGFSNEAITNLSALKDLDEYNKYYNEALELNEAISNIGNYENKTIPFSELTESELENSYILIKDKFTEKHYGTHSHILLDFDEKEMELSDSYICYCYKRVNGSLSFLFLTISNFEEGLISKREFYSDLVIPKELVEDKEVKIIGELTQFNDAVNFQNTYHRWLKLNLTGNCQEDKEFLQNQLENLTDDLFGSKQIDIEDELENLKKRCEN